MSFITGCQTSIPTESLIPAQEVLNAACCKPDSTEQINFLSLRQTPPDEYTLSKGDTLGIYIQGVTGDKDTPPPVNFPEDPGAQPGLGYPVPVRDDGYISLPLVAPIRVTGLTLADAERRIADAYTKDKEILLEGNACHSRRRSKRKPIRFNQPKPSLHRRRQLNGDFLGSIAFW